MSEGGLPEFVKVVDNCETTRGDRDRMAKEYSFWETATLHTYKVQRVAEQA